MSISLALIPHPDSRCSAVTRIDVDIVYRPGMLELRYVVTGAIEQYRLPAPAASARTDELWKHTCFEAFVGSSSGYIEFNFAPSRQWAAYRFDGYRRGMRSAEIALSRIETSAGPDRFELRAELALPEDACGPLGLSAIIEEKNGRKSYWALAHRPGPPDFHHPDCFVLELPPAV